MLLQILLLHRERFPFHRSLIGRHAASNHGVFNDDVPPPATRPDGMRKRLALGKDVNPENSAPSHLSLFLKSNWRHSSNESTSVLSTR